jgi:hypothetical protein
VPSDYAYGEEVSRPDWIKHSRLAAFVFFAALPLSCVSWWHLAGMVLGEESRYTPVLIGLFMTVLILLMDSNLCGALDHRGLTWAGGVSIGLRLIFALGAAISLAVGLVLPTLDTDLALRRSQQALSTEKAVAEDKAEKHRLAEHAKRVASAEEALKAARKAVGTPPADVQAIVEVRDTCLRALEELQRNHEARIAMLDARYRRLKERGLTDTDGDVARELARLRSALADKRRECSRYEQEAAQWAVVRQTSAQRALEDAQARVNRAWNDQAEAEHEANSEIKESSEAAKETWSNKLSANLKVAWEVVVDDGWARARAGVIFVLVLLIELSPFLGKLRLMGGALSQRAADEEDAAAEWLRLKRAVTHAETETLKTAFVEVERCRAAKKRVEAEMVTLRELLTRVCTEADRLREQRDKIAQQPELRPFAAASFRLALAKLLSLFRRQANQGKDS